MPPDQSFKVEIDFVAKNQDLFNKANKEAQQATQSAKAIKNAYELYRGELQKLNPELVKTLDLQKQQAQAIEKSKQAAQELTTRIRNMRAEAKEIRTSVALLKDSADDLDRIAKPLFAGGALVVGGIFAAVNKYANDTENATEATKKWKAAQDDLARSGNRIGEVLTREVAPLLEDAAKITKQIAGTLEAHPEIARGVLAAGLVSLAAGALLKAVTGGIRLVADLKLDAALSLQNRAAQLQLVASENQLRAAGIQAQSSAVPSTRGAGVAGLAAGLASPLGVATIAAGALTAANFFDEQLIKLEDRLQETGTAGTVLAKVLDITTRTAANFVSPLLQIVHTFKDLKTNVTEFFTGAQEVQQQLANTSPAQSFLGGSQENQDRAVQAFSEWRAEDARIVQSAMDERKRIVAEGEKQIVDITRNFQLQRASISAQFSNEAARITERFQQENARADQQFIQDRADAIRQGEERIRAIHAEEQEKREEIEREFAKAARSAAADRDALALVQAQEARDEALEEADRGTAEAIQRERRETQERLQEIATRYAQERQQRQAQYEADLKDNAARRAAALKEAQERYQQELKQAREANAQKLKEAAEAANRERIEKRNQFIAQLQDLGVTLNSERQLRVNAYNAMLSDLTNWLNQMGGAVSSSTTTASSLGTASGGSTTTLNTNPNFSGSGLYGTHDYSGYAYTGVYKMAQNGRPEWVMSGEDTRAAERAVGGQLTQSNVAQMIGLMGAMRGNLSYSPNINSDVSARTRRDLFEDFNRAINTMLGGYG